MPFSKQRSSAASALHKSALARLQLGDVHGAYGDLGAAARLEPNDLVIWQRYEEAYRLVEAQCVDDQADQAASGFADSTSGAPSLDPLSKTGPCSLGRAPHAFRVDEVPARPPQAADAARALLDREPLSFSIDEVLARQAHAAEAACALQPDVDMAARAAATEARLAAGLMDSSSSTSKADSSPGHESAASDRPERRTRLMPTTATIATRRSHMELNATTTRLLDAATTSRWRLLWERRQEVTLVLIWLAIWGMLVCHYFVASDKLALGVVILVPCGLGWGAWLMSRAACSINLSDGFKLFCGAVVLWCIIFHYHRKAVQASAANAGLRGSQS